MNFKVTKKSLSKLNTLENQWSTAFFTIGILICIAFLYLDRRQEISHIIRSAGWFGIVTAIILITLLNMTPIPTENITFMCN